MGVGVRGESGLVVRAEDAAEPYLVASQCDSKQIWYPCDTVIPRLRVRYSHGSEFPRPYPYLPYPRPEHRGYSHTRDEPYRVISYNVPDFGERPISSPKVQMCWT